MANKEALYWAIIRRGWSHIGGFQVMKVTSEHPRMLYGSIDDIGTKIARDYQVIPKKFNSQAEALEVIDKVGKAWDSYEPKLKIARDAEKKLWQERELEIKGLLE